MASSPKDESERILFPLIPGNRALPFAMGLKDGLKPLFSGGGKFAWLAVIRGPAKPVFWEY
jgi:hypothetical protein